MLRRTLIVVLVVAGLAVAAGIALFVRGYQALHPGGRAGAAPPPAPPSALARGEHLAEIACAPCHRSPGFTALAGGHTNRIDPALGEVVAPNLTGAGVLGTYTDAELARAVRDGVARDGRRLLGMPAAGTAWDDADLAAIIAYLRAQPPVGQPKAARRLPFATVLRAGAGLLPLGGPAGDDQPPVRASGLTREHGRQLALRLGCGACHGERLRGGRRGPFVNVPGGNLVAFAAKQSLQGFDDAVRRGIGPDGTVLDRGAMPFAEYRHLDEGEVGALYTYLQSLGDRR